MEGCQNGNGSAWKADGRVKPEQVQLLRPPPIFMSQPQQTQTNVSPLVKDLENVFTIDGRGRPRKCKLFLELLKQYGAEEVVKEIAIMGERKFV